MRKTPAFSSTISNLFFKLFARDELLDLARQFGAVKRLRDIHPADFCLALVGSGFGDEKRSIAAARRLYARITGRSVEESSFFERFNDRLVAVLRLVFERALKQAPPHLRADLADVVAHAGIRDILGIDASQVLLPAAAAEHLPSTDDEHGGLKVTATLSILLQRIATIAVTDARTHDRKALDLARDLKGNLLLFDRGYCDHALFAMIENRDGMFVTRLKASSIPTLVAIREGLGKAHLGARLDAELPYRGTLDVDAAFSMPDGPPRTFRVIRLKVPKGGENIDVWLVTNLRPEHFSAEQVGTLYRLRWSIEKLFHVLKTVGRMDQLGSAKPEVIHAFLYATLIGMLLTQDVCLAMHAARPGCQPSTHRVAMLVTAWLPDIARCIHDEGRLAQVLADLEKALWTEGVNPNPGRRYMHEDYLSILPHAA